jgi:hypothetical protein
MGYQSSEDAKNEYITKMGEPLGMQFHALWQEVTLLHLNWKEYVVLFATSEEDVARLNSAAPAFFAMIQEQLWTSTLLHIARLTDSPRSAGNANLTLRNLTDLVDAKLKLPLAELIDKAIKSAEFARDWRNKVIAHRDLSLALGDGEAEVLATASREKMNDALKAFVDVLNEVQRFYLKGGTSFDAAQRHNAAGTLLHMLKLGLKVKSKQEQHLKAVADGKEQFDATKFDY